MYIAVCSNKQTYFGIRVLRLPIAKHIHLINLKHCGAYNTYKILEIFTCYTIKLTACELIGYNNK